MKNRLFIIVMLLICSCSDKELDIEYVFSEIHKEYPYIPDDLWEITGTIVRNETSDEYRMIRVTPYKTCYMWIVVYHGKSNFNEKYKYGEFGYESIDFKKSAINCCSINKFDTTYFIEIPIKYDESKVFISDKKNQHALGLHAQRIFHSLRK